MGKKAQRLKSRQEGDCAASSPSLGTVEEKLLLHTVRAGGLLAAQSPSCRDFSRWRCRRIHWSRLSLAIVAFTAGCHHQPAAPVFDVPSLLGKNIDDLTKSIPSAIAGDVPATSNTGTQQRNFTKDGHTLHVFYKPTSRKVTEFDLDVDPQTGAIKDDDKASFLSLGNLKEVDTRYAVELTEDPNKVFYFTSAKITPNPLTHHVVFSITGTEALTDITYATRTNGADVKTDNLQTLPPWQTEMDITVAATDDTDLMLQAKPYSGPAFSPTRIPVPADYKTVLQIVVDGRVASTATCTGFTTNCLVQL